MSVKQLDVNPRYITSLLNARIQNVNKLLIYSNLELQKRSGLNKDEAEQVLKAASCSILSSSCKPCTALDISVQKDGTEDFQTHRLSTGCKEIDDILKGGLLYPSVTEITGESASGKTQLCLQLCLTVQLMKKELHVGSLYVCTEDVFPTKRLQGMVRCFCESNKHVLDGKTAVQVSNDIFIEHASDMDDLMSLLEIRLPVLLARKKIKLIIIDSITALFRVAFESWELSARAKMLAKVGSLLRNFTITHRCCVVCVNQVSSVIEHKSCINPASLDNNKVIPALGLAWSYHVTTRIMLSRTQYTVSMFDNKPGKNKIKDHHNTIVRCFSICFSPHLPSTKCYFLVTQDGIQGFQFPA